MKQIFLICICLLLGLTADAQVLNKKMGNPTMEEMNMTECAYDKDAKAVVLYEDYDVALAVLGTIKLEMDFKKRIKILKEDGLNAATVSLTIRDDEDKSGYHDDIHGIKATTYNLVGGKIEKVKMEGKMVSRQRINPNAVKVEFALPQVQVGSVIEYQYTIDRDAIFNLPTWVAQNRFPTNYAHFRIKLPNFFSFHVNVTGSNGLQAKKDTDNDPDFDAPDDVYDITGTNLPALPEDNDYIFCPADFADKVTCELTTIAIPGQNVHNYTATQEDVNKMLLDDDNFGGRLKQKNPLKDEMASLGIAGFPTAKEKAVGAIVLLRKHLRWNEKYALTGSSLSKVLKEGSGDNADLNFVLLSMLKDAGVQAYPVVMSNRSAGRLPYGRPSVDALTTFVVAFVDEEGLVHFYDASAENGYIDALPDELNVDRAILIQSVDTYQEISLQQNVKHRQSVAINASLSADGVLSGTCTNTYMDNAALEFRDSWEAKNDSAAYVGETAADNNIEISEYSTKGREEFSPKAVETYTFSRQLDGDGKFYLNPLVMPYMDKSPFTAETSKMPVEFGAAGMTNITVNIKLPEGYHAEEMIKPLVMSLPDNGLAVRLIIGENAGTITANCRMNTNRLFFGADEYTLVKQFYDALVNKCNEMLVVSKPQQ